MGKTEAAILEYVFRFRTVRAKDLEPVLSLAPQSIPPALAKMAAAGLLARTSRGTYRLPRDVKPANIYAIQPSDVRPPMDDAEVRSRVQRLRDDTEALMTYGRFPFTSPLGKAMVGVLFHVEIAEHAVVAPAENLV